MAEEDSFISDIPSYFMVLTALGIITMLFIGGLLNVDVQISVDQRADYRTATVLENVLSLDAQGRELEQTQNTEKYEYDRRRAVIPIEYFTNKNPQNTDVGYKKKDEHCYLPKIPRLDGDNFAYRIVPMEDEGKHASPNVKKIPDECQGMDFSDNSLQGTYLRRSVISPALLVRKDTGDPALPARIYVYYIKSYDQLSTLELGP